MVYMFNISRLTCNIEFCDSHELHVGVVVVSLFRTLSGVFFCDFCYLCNGWLISANF